MADFSIYPGAIDGYAQLPLVVDNITRIDAVTVNRLRSAIINIEKELGTIPSGEDYDTVSDRLNALETMLNELVVGTGSLQEAYNSGGTIELNEDGGNLVITGPKSVRIGTATEGVSSFRVNSDSTARIISIEELELSSSQNIILDSGSEGTLINSDGHIELSDQYRSSGGFSEPIKLSSSATEWSDFETNFGEVSLLNAINQAASAGGSTTLQAAYDGGNSITTSGGNNIAYTLGLSEGGFTIDGGGEFSIGATTRIDSFQLNASSDALISADNLNIYADQSAGSALSISALGLLNLTSSGILDLDSADTLQINSSGGAIQIGNDSVSQDIDIGTSGSRTINIGSTNSLARFNILGGTSNATFPGENNIGSLGSLNLSAYDNSGSFVNMAFWSLNDGAGNAQMTFISKSSIFFRPYTSSSAYLSFGSSVIKFSSMDFWSSGSFDVNSDGAITIDSSGGTIGIGTDAVAQAISIGTGAAARVITIGNGTGGTSLVLNAGTGSISIGTSASARTTSIATGAAAQTVTLGSTNSTSSTTIQTGTGAMTFTAGGIFDINATGAISLDSTSIASNFTLTANSASNATITINASNAGAGVGRVVINTDTSGEISIGENTTGSVRIGSIFGGSLLTYNGSTGYTHTSYGNGSYTLNMQGGSGSINFNAGTGSVNIGTTASARSTNIATGAAAQIVTLGSTNTTSSLTLNSGTGAMTFAAGGAFDVNATGIITLDSTSASGSNFTTTAANSTLTLSAAGGGTNQVIITSAGTGSDAIRIQSSDTAGGIDIDAGTNGIDILTTGDFYVDTVNDISLNSSGGYVNLIADIIKVKNSDETNSVEISATANEEITIGTTYPMVYNGTTGKLTIPGIIDPTAIIFEKSSAPTITLGGTEGSLFVSDGSGSLDDNTLYYQGPSSISPINISSPTLSNILGNDNQTDGNNIILSYNDYISAQDTDGTQNGASIKITPGVGSGGSFASLVLTVTSIPSAGLQIIFYDENVSADFGLFYLASTSGTRTSGLNDYKYNQATTNAVAQEIAAAINDPLNNFNHLFIANATSNQVTLTSARKGTYGNNISFLAQSGTGISPLIKTFLSGGTEPTYRDGNIILGSDDFPAIIASMPTLNYGRGAIDLQKIRTADTDIASGLESIILNGTGNRVDGDRSSIINGYYNKVLSDLSTIAGGFINYIGDQSIFTFIGGGEDNYIDYSLERSDYSSIISGGSNGIIDSNYASICSGLINYIENSDYSSVSGGETNSIYDSNHCHIAGGDFNTINLSIGSVISGGSNNAFSTDANVTIEYGVIAGGNSNSLYSDTGFTSSYSAISGGKSNTIYSSYSNIAGGESNYIDVNVADHSSILGGESNEIWKSYSSITHGLKNEAQAELNRMGGKYGIARNYGEDVYSAGSFSGSPLNPTGDAQRSESIWFGSTTTATPKDLLLDNSSQRFIIPNNSVMKFTFEVVARSSGGDGAGFKVSGVIKKGATAATAALVGSPTVEITGREGVLLTATVTAVADTTNGALVPQVTGVALTTIKWVAVMTSSMVVG